MSYNKALKLSKCPFCKGKGELLIRTKFHSIPNELKLRCIELRRQGLSFREIAKKVGMKNPQSVVSAILTYTNQGMKYKPSKAAELIKASE